MVNEHEEMLRALEKAIEMEKDSKECYLGAIKATENSVARKLLQSFMEEEDIHQHKFVEIYNAIRANKTWPAMDPKVGSDKKFKELLINTCQAIGIDAAANATPIHVLDAAIDKEDNSYNFYRGKANQSIFESERSFYNALALEEREHYLILVGYKEFLEDPAGWFTKSEHWSMDGA